MKRGRRDLAPARDDWRGRRRSSLLLLGLAMAMAWGGGETRAARKVSDQAPFSVRVEVRWGSRKNKESYRGDLEHAIIGRLLELACFRQVVEGGGSDLVLEVQINDLMTEQEYSSSESIIPGQGEDHQLLAARASMNLDYWLRGAGGDRADLLSGHVYRSVLREPLAPVDPAEARALRDLTTDASRWLVRELCDHRGRLAARVGGALKSAKPTP